MDCGILPIIKPAGPSSAAVVGQVRRITGIKKVGHSGTLDPAAEGLLVLAFKRATAILSYLPSDKTYHAVVCLGKTTDSLDVQGKIQSQHPVPSLSAVEVSAALQRFSGPQWQKPPMVSAVHYRGERLYRIARRGEQVEMPPRKVTIYHIQLRNFQSPFIEFEVACSGGTYIRSLAADLGAALGCGGYLHHLTRTACGGFTLSEAIDLEALTRRGQKDDWKQRLVTLNQALRHIPAVYVDGRDETAVRNGRSIPGLAPPEPEAGPVIRILNPNHRLLAMARWTGEELVMQRVLCPAGEEIVCE